AQAGEQEAAGESGASDAGPEGPAGTMMRQDPEPGGLGGLPADCAAAGGQAAGDRESAKEALLTTGAWFNRREGAEEPPHLRQRLVLGAAGRASGEVPPNGQHVGARQLPVEVRG